MSLVKGVFIVGAKRTVFGTYGGNLKDVSLKDLQTAAAKAVLASANVAPEKVDSVIIGNVNPTASPDGIFVARHTLLNCGIPIEKNGYSVNRLCGSGFQSIVNGCLELTTGSSKIVLTGGVENMSATPHYVRNIRFGTTLGVNPVLEDSILEKDSYCGLPMALTAEKLGAQYKLTREEVDEYALSSQQKWKAAQDAGRFKDEIVPVEYKTKKGVEKLEIDEHPRPNTTMEALRKLPTIFKKNGLVTAGSASGISDGAGAVLIATEEAATQTNLKPLARIVGYAIVGVEPSIMGIGPAPAIKQLLKTTGTTLNDIDLVEINEAFSCQALACVKELQLDINKLNVNGGAVAMGHPLGASGSRIMGHLVYELRRRGKKYGIGSACIGGGQGIAIMVEAL